MSGHTIDRRTFILGCAGGLGCITGWNACSTSSRAVLAVRETGWPLRVPASALGASGQATIRRPSPLTPILLRVTGTSYHAVELRCTHSGCETQLRRDRLVCPCHGSEFELDGRVVRGPAEQPLRAHPVSIAPDGYLLIERG